MKCSVPFIKRKATPGIFWAGGGKLSLTSMDFLENRLGACPESPLRRIPKAEFPCCGSEEIRRELPGHQSGRTDTNLFSHSCFGSVIEWRRRCHG